MYRLLFALVFCAVAAIVATSGSAKAAPPSQTCRAANDSYTSAKAAQMSADFENASTLYRTAIEQFEACRAEEDLNSSERLRDTSSEADALIAAATISLNNHEMEHAHAQLVGATGLLVELCAADSLPSEVYAQVEGNVFGLRRFGAMVGIPQFGACPAVKLPDPLQTPSR